MRRQLPLGPVQRFKERTRLRVPAPPQVVGNFPKAIQRGRKMRRDRGKRDVGAVQGTSLSGRLITLPKLLPKGNVLANQSTHGGGVVELETARRTRSRRREEISARPF